MIIKSIIFKEKSFANFMEKVEFHTVAKITICEDGSAMIEDGIIKDWNDIELGVFFDKGIFLPMDNIIIESNKEICQQVSNKLNTLLRDFQYSEIMAKKAKKRADFIRNFFTSKIFKF